MTDPAEQILHGLGKATSAFVSAALGELTPEGRAALAEQLMAGSKLCIIIDIHPTYAARLVLRPESGPAMTLATLMAQVPGGELQ
jgi:hypothetical protein